jgi:hypothetical protein
MALFLVRRARPRFERFSTSFDVNVRNLSDLRPTRDPGPGTRFRSAQVNDNDDVAAAGGGSHWSLLAYLRDENAFAHFDSAGGRNDAAAARLAETLAEAFSLKNSPAFVSGRSGSPRQRNGYDCGVFALATAHAARRLVAREGASGATASRLAARVAREVTPSAVGRFRGELVETVRALAEARARANAANRESWCSHVDVYRYVYFVYFVYFVFVIPSRRVRRARVSTRCPPAPSPRKTPPAARRT